jgi:SnoaL-like domain
MKVYLIPAQNTTFQLVPSLFMTDIEIQVWTPVILYFILFLREDNTVRRNASQEDEVFLLILHYKEPQIMNTASLHSPIVRQTIEAINEGRLDDFMALFAPDAAVIDGPTYQGHESIRAWAQRETFGVHMRIIVQQEKNADGTIIDMTAKSQGGYSGPGTFSFTIQSHQIKRLVIS